MEIELDAAEILVGPNASGKSTLLDVIRFLGDLVSKGFDEAIHDRSDNLKDLIWQKEGDHFEIAIEAAVPAHLQTVLPQEYERCRYEVSIGIDSTSQENSILSERVLLMFDVQEPPPVQRILFPEPATPPDTLLRSVRRRGMKTVVNKVSGGNDNFYDETGKGWDHSFKLGPRRSALANLPEDETKFPVSTWLKRILLDGTQNLVLNSLVMRRPSPPGMPRGFRSDGSNLPWAIEVFRKNPDSFRRWLDHIRTALPDIATIETTERPEDRHRYLQVVYRSGLTIPSWVLSDGTLRLLALTLVAYLDQQAIYMVEEPENGIHPQAVETGFQALSSAYDSQILCATHSPVIKQVSESNQAREPERVPIGIMGRKKQGKGQEIARLKESLRWPLHGLIC